MGNNTVLNIIATGHAMDHSSKNEPWYCQCLACKFMKEYKFPVQEDDGTIRDGTVAEAIIDFLEKEDYKISIPQVEVS